MSLLRVAEPSDADQLTTVFLDCWRITYSPVLPARLVEGMTAQKARSMWEEALARADLTLVAATADEPPHGVLGFIGFRREADGTGYISSLYVSPHSQKGGVGRALLAEAEDRLRRAGAPTARLWVFAENAPSVAFYRRRGWEPDGREETLPEWGEPQLSMSKTLSG